MARYERAILEPYLRDVRFVELDYSRLQKELNESEKEIQRLRAYLGDYGDKREKPNPLSYHEFGSMSTEIWHIVCGVAATCFFGWLGASILTGAAVIYTLLCALLIVIQISGEKGRYKKDKNEYLEYLDSIEPSRDKLAVLRKHREEIKEQIEVAGKLRTEIYSVGIIAKQFRNVSAACYLYDYYTSSGEDDLDKIIQTMLLSGILDREHEIVEQNSRMLLNQREQIANQEALSRQLADNHRQEMMKLADLESNQRIQHNYQRMIATNQLVTNYILSETYRHQIENT